MRRARVDRRARPRVSPWRVSTLVFLLAGALIVISSAGLVHVGFIASREADAQTAQNDQKLFDNALRDRQVLMAREQLSVARWHRTYENVVLAFNKSYTQEEIVESLWNDFAHNETYIIAPGQVLRMAAQTEEASFPDSRLDESNALHKIAERAIERFMQQRVAVEGGFMPKHIAALNAMDVAEFGFANMNGRPSMLSAMPLVPDDDGKHVMPDAPPWVLVSVKYFAGEFSEELNAQLRFEDFAFRSENYDKFGNQKPIFTLDGEKLGVFGWTSAKTGAQIWNVVVPIVSLLALALALSSLLIARKIGQISQRLEESEAKNRRLALHDTLTGLANRLQFNQALSDAIARLPDENFAIIACDLDRFKAVNDTYGHAGGDTVIRTVAERLRACVGGAGLVARTGGDEFVILVTAWSDVPRLTVLSQQIIARVCEPIPLERGAMTDVGTSLGIAIAPDSGISAESIMAAGDAALYAAKARGRGIAVFAKDMHPHKQSPAPEEDATRAA